MVAFGFPLGQALAVGKSDPAVNVTRGKALKVVAKDGKPSEIVAELSISPGNSGGPLLDKRGLVVGVIRARLENRATGKGVSLAIPVNRLEWFLSRPEITVSPRAIARAAAEKSVEFRAELKTLFRPRDPVKIELTLRDPSGAKRQFPMSRADTTYRARAVPFPGPRVKPTVRLMLITGTDPSSGRVKDQPLSGTPAGVPDAAAGIPAPRSSFRLADIRRVRLRPTLELEGAFPILRATAMQGNRAGRVVGPVRGLDEVLASLEEQLPNFDPEEPDEIEVKPERGECLLIVRRAGTVVANVECDDRDLKVGSQTFRLSDARRLDLGKVAQAELAHKERLEGPIDGLERLLGEIRRRTPGVDPKVLTKIVVNPRDASETNPSTLHATLAARRAGIIVAWLESEIEIEELERPSLEALSRGRFIRPRRSPTPVTSLRLRASPDDPFVRCNRAALADEFRRCRVEDPAGTAGPEQSFLFEGGRLFPGWVSSGGMDHVSIQHRFAAWRVDFHLPRGQAPGSDEYLITEDDQPGLSGHPTAIGITMAGGNQIVVRPPQIASRRLVGNPPAGGDGAPRQIRYSGRVRVWELGDPGRARDRVAIDFILRYQAKDEKTGAVGDRVIVGMYRWHSSFE